MFKVWLFSQYVITMLIVVVLLYYYCMAYTRYYHLCFLLQINSGIFLLLQPSTSTMDKLTSIYQLTISTLLLLTTHAHDPPWSFVDRLHDLTWEFNPTSCLYVKNHQAGTIAEVVSPNNPVIWGSYEQYQVSNGFDSYNNAVFYCFILLFYVGFIDFCVVVTGQVFFVLSCVVRFLFNKHM